MVRVFCLSGWATTPDVRFWPSLCAALELKGHTVIKATEPCSDGEIPKHCSHLKALVDANGGIGPDCFFIGWSIGAQIIHRYLASQPAGTTVGGTACLAAWVDLAAATVESLGVEKVTPWIADKIDTEALQKVCGTLLCFVSTDDKIVGLLDKHEASVRSVLSWADVQVATDRGHYQVEALTEGEMEKISAMLSL